MIVWKHFFLNYFLLYKTMKSKNKILKYLVFLLTISIVNSSFAENSCSKWLESNKTITTSIVFDCNTEIWANLKTLNKSNVSVNWNLKLLENAIISWDLIVKWDLELSSNITIKWNLIVEWDIKWNASNLKVSWYIKANNIELWKNIITQIIISNWNIDLWSNSMIWKWIISNWYLKTGSDFLLNWYSKIRWDFITASKFKWNWVLYVYWNLISETNYEFKWDKLKIQKNYKTNSNADNLWRIYIYWIKNNWSNYNENNKKLWYLIWEIDPLLKFSLTEKEFNTIKNKTINSDKKVYHFRNEAAAINNSLANEFSKVNKDNIAIQNYIYKLNKIKYDSINEYTNLFNYLDTQIENEDFDINKYNTIKENSLNRLKNYMNWFYWEKVTVTIETITKKIEKNEEIKIETNNSWEKTEIIKNEENKEIILPKKIEAKLDFFANQIKFDDKKSIYEKIIVSIDKSINEKNKNSEILKLIKKYLQDDLINSEILNWIWIK